MKRKIIITATSLIVILSLTWDAKKISLTGLRFLHPLPVLFMPMMQIFYQVQVRYMLLPGGLTTVLRLQAIGDVLGGNSQTDNYNGRGAYLTFSVSATDASGSLQSAYNAFWSVISNANIVAYNIKNAAPGASESGKNSGLAECRFMRAAAYYYLALDWGAVPIIYDNIYPVGRYFSIRRSNLADVWKFMIMDLTWAKDHLSAAPLQPGRITKWSAEGMLARAYLVTIRPWPIGWGT